MRGRRLAREHTQMLSKTANKSRHREKYTMANGCTTEEGAAQAGKSMDAVCTGGHWASVRTCTGACRLVGWPCHWCAALCAVQLSFQATLTAQSLDPPTQQGSGPRRDLESVEFCLWHAAAARCPPALP